MNSLITGGAGFIGSHLIDSLLKKGNKVTVLDNYSTGRSSNLDHIKNVDLLQFIKCDISDGGAIEKHFENVDLVFHLAALADIVPSIEDPSNYISTNVMGTVKVLEASRHSKVKKFVYAASASCYGITRKKTRL